MSRPLLLIVPLLSFLAVGCATKPVVETRFYCEPVPVHLMERPDPMPLPPPTMTVEQAEQIISLYMDVYVKNALRLIELQRAVEARQDTGQINENN